MRSGVLPREGFTRRTSSQEKGWRAGGLSSPTAAVTLPGWSIAGQEPRLRRITAPAPANPPHPTPPPAVSQRRRWKQADPPQEAGDPLQVSTPLCPVLFMTPQHIQGAQGAQSRLGSRWKTQ